MPLGHLSADIKYDCQIERKKKKMNLIKNRKKRCILNYFVEHNNKIETKKKVIVYVLISYERQTSYGSVNRDLIRSFYVHYHYSYSLKSDYLYKKTILE